uniref:BTB domain-containing protein n=1 Tax=Meloidogyne javanica TaxID=6303 RepID=A0A915MH82_MELJA
MSSADVLNKVETVTCKIEWKLQDLHRYRDFVANETFFNSKQFYNPQYPTAAWELRVYFNAYSNLITLAQVKQTLKVKYVLYALDARGGRVNISSVTPHDFNRFKETIRYTIDMERLMHTDGSVLLFCELEFLPHNLKRGRKLKRKHDEIGNFSTPNFQKLLINMFEQETLTNCVINIENKRINAHRCILAQNSEVFFRMFEHGGQQGVRICYTYNSKCFLVYWEISNGEINIVDSSYECFLAMIKYFYSGEVDKVSLEEFSEELFTIAEKYLVLPLKEICERFMASGIVKLLEIKLSNFVLSLIIACDRTCISFSFNICREAKNFRKRYLYAEIHGLPMIKKACIDFISANRKKFLASNEWKQFVAEDKGRADQLLITVAYEGDIA